MAFQPAAGNVHEAFAHGAVADFLDHLGDEGLDGGADGRIGIEPLEPVGDGPRYSARPRNFSVSPEGISVLATGSALAPAWQKVVDTAAADRAAIAGWVQHRVKTLVGISTRVVVHAPNEMERTQTGKARRVVDNRPR